MLAPYLHWWSDIIPIYWRSGTSLSGCRSYSNFYKCNTYEYMNTYQASINLDCANTVPATWDPDCIGSGSNFSKIPTGLTNGVNALWIGDNTVGTPNHEFDNAYFNCGGTLTSVSSIRASVNNASNWVKDNITTPQFTLPRNCNFLNVLAVSLINFSGKLNVNKSASLQWKVEESYNINKFIIEKSSDGITFKPLTTVNASSSTNGMYYYTDNELLAQNNYYRIKIIELSGKIFYSNIVSVNLKSEVDISVYPNPVVDKLTIQQFGSQYNKIAYLYASTGKIEQQINITSQQHSINIKTLAAGVYYLKMNGGKVFKIIKQ
jgi:Secretion system C-terminal sorting domain